MMKKMIFLWILILSFLPIRLLSVNEKPYHFEGPGYNGKYHNNIWASNALVNSWQVMNIKYSPSGELDWANFKCHNPGSECKAGSWYTVWHTGISRPDWPLDDNGEPVPPLPQEAGNWQSINLYPIPMHYDPLTGNYY